jgi:hypothetical protein
MAAYSGMAMTSQTSLASGMDGKYGMAAGQGNKYISAMDFLYTLVVVNSNSFISHPDWELVILYRIELSYLEYLLSHDVARQLSRSQTTLVSLALVLDQDRAVYTDPV